MRTIRVDCNADNFTYEDEWKGYVYSPEDEFDDVFVITGNRDYKGIASASWYQEALKYIEENDIEKTETKIMEVLNKLYPDDTFENFTIRGSVQGEWQNVFLKSTDVYVADDMKETLADFYFGYVTEIIDEEEGCSTYVSNSEMWKHEDDIKNFVCDLLCIDPEEEEIRILVSDGFTVTKKWKEIS